MSEWEKSCLASGEAIAAARPRQRRYSSTTEQMSGSPDVYRRHQFRMQNEFVQSGISKRKKREIKDCNRRKSGRGV